MLLWLYLLFPIIIAYYLLKTIWQHKRFRRIVDKIPGPPAIWIFGNVLQFKFNRLEFVNQMIDIACLHCEKGLFRVWVGPKAEIVLLSADLIEPILNSNKLIEKSSNYELLKTWIGSGLLISGGEKWRYRRKMLTPTFHFSILGTFIEVYCNQANVLVDQLKTFGEQKLSFNIYPYIGRCALDIICETAMGVHVNAQKVHKSEYVQAVSKMCEVLFKYERMPWLWFKPIFNVLYGKEYTQSLRILRSFIEKVISERIEERNQASSTIEGDQKKRRLAFLDLLLNMQNEHKLVYEDIREEGHDTTSASMSWTLFLLGHHRHVQDKAYEELENIFGNDQRDPVESDLKEMKYLECVIKEALRMFPPVPIFARMVTENIKTGTFIIPKGADVLVSPFFVHRDPEIWGNDAEVFKPERFIADRASTERHPYGYIPFSAGSRNCIGQKFALMEEKVVLSTLIRNFEIRSLDPIENLIPVPDIILRPSNGINVRLSCRRKSSV